MAFWHTWHHPILYLHRIRSCVGHQVLCSLVMHTSTGWWLVSTGAHDLDFLRFPGVVFSTWIGCSPFPWRLCWLYSTHCQYGWICSRVPVRSTLCMRSNAQCAGVCSCIIATAAHNHLPALVMCGRCMRSCMLKVIITFLTCLFVFVSMFFSFTYL